VVLLELETVKVLNRAVLQQRQYEMNVVRHSQLTQLLRVLLSWKRWYLWGIVCCWYGGR